MNYDHANGGSYAMVRTERNGLRVGRTYSIDFIADDGNGGGTFEGRVYTYVPSW